MLTHILLGSVLAGFGEPRTMILTYHDVILRRGKGSVWFDTTVSELREQLDWLQKQRAKFLTIQEFEAGLKSGKLAKNSVLITFADNYRGFYQYGLPELKKRGIPSVMFVHTGYVGSPKGRPKMSWSELRECERSGVTVSSQTVSHPADLTQLSDEELRKEFAVSQASLRKHTSGRGASYLAYPNGKFDSRVSELAKMAGYRLAFTEAQQPAQKAPDAWRIPRYVHTKMRQAWSDLQRGQK